ncbi:MAG: tail protein X [Desulfobacterales bacterium]|nr:tail protein X [Desulfobacterales bacterium]
MVKQYTTHQGDTFDIIARRIWGNEKLMHRLIEANPAHQDTVFFNANKVLDVPDIHPVSTEPVPPWK